MVINISICSTLNRLAWLYNTSLAFGSLESMIMLYVALPCLYYYSIGATNNICPDDEHVMTVDGGVQLEFSDVPAENERFFVFSSCSIAAIDAYITNE